LFFIVVSRLVKDKGLPLQNTGNIRITPLIFYQYAGLEIPINRPNIGSIAILGNAKRVFEPVVAYTVY